MVLEVMQQKNVRTSSHFKTPLFLDRSRPPVLEEMKNLLLLFVKKKEFSGDNLSEDAICAKAKLLNEDLIKEIILERKSIFKTKHYLFLPIFIYGIQYTVQFVV